MSINLGPYTNTHEMNLDWIIKEWYETKESLIGDQHQWQEFKTNMSNAWDAYKEATDAGIADKEAKLDEQYKAFTKAINTKIDENHTAFESLKKYCEDYFDNLDISKEIVNKIDKMSKTGELINIIGNTVGDNVTSWLNANIKNPLNPVVDNSFLVSGAVPDSELTGKLSFLSRLTLNMLSNRPSENYTVTDINKAWEQGTYFVGKSGVASIISNPSDNNFLVVMKSVSGVVAESKNTEKVVKMLYSIDASNEFKVYMSMWSYHTADATFSQLKPWVQIPVGIDTTLKLNNVPADAKIVGDKITSLTTTVGTNKTETDAELLKKVGYITSDYDGVINTSGLDAGMYYYTKSKITDELFPGIEKDKIVDLWMCHEKDDGALKKIVSQSAICRYNVSGVTIYKVYFRTFESANLPTETSPKWVCANTVKNNVSLNESSRDAYTAVSEQAVGEYVDNKITTELESALTLREGTPEDNGNLPGLYTNSDGSVTVNITNANMETIQSLILRKLIPFGSSNKDANILTLVKKSILNDTINLTNLSNILLFTGDSKSKITFGESSYNWNIYDYSLNIAIPFNYHDINSPLILICTLSTTGNKISFRLLRSKGIFNITVE